MLLAGDTASFARTTRAAASSGSERSEPRRNSSFPESAEISERLKGSASATSRNADPAEAVDALWESLPIDQLRRPGEIGWDIDPDGPTGAEKFDNLWGKVGTQDLLLVAKSSLTWTVQLLATTAVIVIKVELSAEATRA